MSVPLQPVTTENVYFAAGNHRLSVHDGYISLGNFTIEVEEKINYVEVYVRVGSEDVETNIFIGWINEFKDLCIHGVREARVDSKRGLLRVYVETDMPGVSEERQGRGCEE